MITKYIADQAVIGSTIIEALDGGLMLMYSSDDGKHFFKSYDNFRTIAEEWIVPIDTRTANANFIRLKDNRLMMIVRRLSTDPKIEKIKGASYFTYFSDDDGRTFYEGKRINEKEECFYIMNDRILRLESGRIIIPVCYVPTEFIVEELFEKAGQSGCFYSDDEGETWNHGEWLPAEDVDQLCEPMIAQGPDGLLHMYMRTGYGYLYHAVSDDEGKSFSKAVSSSLRSPCAPFTLKYDKISGKFFAIWDNAFPAPHPSQNYPRSPICLAESTDCKNWKMICELDNSPMHAYGYPNIYFVENVVIITYYESPDRKHYSPSHSLKLKIFDRRELQL